MQRHVNVESAKNNLILQSYLGKNINSLTTKCQGTLLNSEENVRVEILVDYIFTEQDMAVAHMK